LSLHQLKTGSRIQIPIHPALLKRLEAVASQAGDQPAAFLTPSLAEAETGGAHGLSRQFAAIMREAGVSAGKTSSGTRRQQSERGFHSLRHTFISALAGLSLLGTWKVENPSKSWVLGSKVCTTSSDWVALRPVGL
jgi:integrase